MLKIHELYCDKTGPNDESEEHGIRPAALFTQDTIARLCAGFNSTPDAHGGELAAIDLGRGLRRALRCLCGAPMRYRTEHVMRCMDFDDNEAEPAPTVH